MPRAFKSQICIALLSGAAFSQSTDTPSKFEAADVRVAVRTANSYPYARGPFMRGGRYELRYATMVDLIKTACGVDADKVLGGPNWLEMDRFDVIAKVPARSTQDSAKTMLQALLADRFKLVVHNDTRPIPAYALTAGKRTALRKADGSGDTGCKFIPPAMGPEAGVGPRALPVLQFDCRNMTMAAFAEGMRNMPAAQIYLNNPVVDKTGLEGAWDFTFKFSLRGMAAFGGGETTTLFDAVDKQLGLKLEPANVPMPVIMVDSVNQKPSANLPGVAESLQVAAPTEFEVAEVKPSDPDAKGIKFQIQPGGRVNIAGLTLKLLIEQAWGINDEMLVGAPKWMDSDRFDIIAKAPAIEPAAGPSPGPQVDFDSVQLMLRALLAERFKLAVHNEERPMSAYTLVSVKPKMKKADPASRTKFQEGPASLDAKDPRNSNAALSRLVTVQNMTMDQFAEQLQWIASGYVHSPVLNATGLDGAYDFTLSFSPAGMAQALAGPGGGAGPPSGATGEASDPNGSMTLPEAVEKQLGLKLEMRKRPVSVLVIDRVEQKPTDN